MNKKYLAAVLVVVILCCTACSTGKSQETITCQMSIDCKSVVEKTEELSDSVKKVIPENGVILESIEVQVKKGSSVYDVLQKVCRENNIVFEKNATAVAGDVYIEGIANLYQMDCGKLSGWLCSVNGELLSTSCNKTTVDEGDVIQWQYTCNMGEDLK